MLLLVQQRNSDTSAWAFPLEKQARVMVELETGGKGRRVRSMMGPVEGHQQSEAREMALNWDSVGAAGG